MAVLFGALLYGAVPLLLVGVIGGAFWLPSRPVVGQVPGEEATRAICRAGRSGSAAGLVLTALYVVAAYVGDTGLVVGLVRVLGLDGFDGVTIGLLVAVLVGPAYLRLRRSIGVGFLCMTGTAAAGASLFNLYFSPPLQTFTLAAVLSVTFGLLVGSIVRRHAASAGH